MQCPWHKHEALHPPSAAVRERSRRHGRAVRQPGTCENPRLPDGPALNRTKNDRWTKSAIATEYPVPDIAPYRRGNTGIDYVHTFDSGRLGPHVMINALTHGNEVCGAYAVDRLFRWETRPARGKLTLSFANVDAFSRFSRERPADSRWVDEDFNRVWSDDKLDGARASAELVRARVLRPLIAAADLLLDLHSMHLPGAAGHDRRPAREGPRARAPPRLAGVRDQRLGPRERRPHARLRRVRRCGEP